MQNPEPTRRVFKRNPNRQDFGQPLHIPKDPIQAVKEGYFDPEAYVEQFISSGLDSSVFSLLDDRDMPRAANVVEWVTGKQFLGIQDAPPWPRQLQFLLHLFADYCPRCSNPAYVNSLHQQPYAEILSNIQVLEHGVCPKCHTNRIQFVQEDLLRSLPYEFAGCGGQRIGKSVFLGMAGSYQTHRMLGLPNPNKHFGVQSSNIFHGTFTAVDFTQAYENLWEPFLGMIDNSPWFKQYHDLLDSLSAKHGLPPQYEVQKISISYKHKRLAFSPASPNQRKMRGRTRFFASIDEIGWFDFDDGSKERKITLSAEGIYDALSNSLKTVRAAADARFDRGDYNSPTGLMVNASSPSNVNDMIMKLVRTSIKAPRRIVWHGATWEAHPTITFKQIEEEGKDPATIARDFGAIPPLAASPFISNTDAVLEIVSHEKIPNLLRWAKAYHTDKSNRKTLYWSVSPGRIDRFTPRALAIDLGSVNNSFGIALLSLNQEVVEVDEVIEFKPEPNIPINFALMFEHVILPIVQNYAIVTVLYDQWQSKHQMDSLRTTHSTRSEQYSLTMDDFEVFRTDLYGHKLQYPRTETDAKVIFDLSKDMEITVSDRPRLKLVAQTCMVNHAGRKVTKPSGNLSDDLFRAVVLGHCHIRSNERLYRYAQGRITHGSNLGEVRTTTDAHVPQAVMQTMLERSNTSLPHDLNTQYVRQFLSMNQPQRGPSSQTRSSSVGVSSPRNYYQGKR